MQTESLPRIFESLDAFLAATEPGFKASGAAPDPLERFHVVAEFWTGRIGIQPDGRALPETVFIASTFEAKQAARKGWRPFRDSGGACALPPKVVSLFADFFKGSKEIPPRVADILPKPEAPKPPEPTKAPEAPKPEPKPEPKK